MDQDTIPTERAFVLGLDGVPWDMLESWMDEGRLPNFSRLRDEGAAGPLQSTTPATTPLAWPSIATGVWPDKHGVYGFQKLSSEYTHQMYTSRDVGQPALWDVLSPAVVANVPMTYPASPIDGELVTGMMTPEQRDGFTHPPELGDRIRAEIPDYRIGLKWSEYGDRKEEFLEDMDTLVAARRQLMHLLMDREDWRLFFFVYTAPDRIQHLLWDDAVLLDHYETLDEILGEVMEYVTRREATLFVVSDHGFGPISKFVSVNRVLEKEGYLVRQGESGTRGLFSEVGVTRDTILSTLNRAGITGETLVRYLPRALVDQVATHIPGDHVLYDVDYENTKAFVHGPGSVYINDTERFDGGIVDPSEVPGLKTRLQELFAGVNDPETGEPALRVYDGDDLFPTDPDSPDLVVRPRDGYQKSTTLTEEVFTDTGTTQASHRSTGIFFAWGPDVEAGNQPIDASVVDVTPTLLHAVGEPVPANTDGSVLNIFSGDSSTAQRRVESRGYANRDAVDTARDDDFEDVKERLQGLGYME